MNHTRQNGNYQAHTDPYYEKGLPANLEAERTILGAILLDNSVCNQAVETMRRDDFYLDSHRRIFDKMCALSQRGEVVDLVTLSEVLRRANEFEQVGGATYIASLIDGVPRTDTIKPYADIVRSKAHLRKLISASNQILVEAFDEELEPEEIHCRALRRIEESDEASDTFRKPVIRLMRAEELEGLPPVEWLIDGEIPRNALTLMYGESGAGKSFVALDMAARVAQSGPVVYVAAEGGSGYGSRLRAWRRLNDKPTDELFFYPDAVQMTDQIALRAFIKEIGKVKPQLVVIDTLARCLVGGDENSAKDMGIFVEACARIQHETGTTVLIIHHKGKTASGPRGSSALFGAADAIIELTNDEGLIQIKCTKMKDAEPFKTRCLRLVPAEDSLAVVAASRVIVNDVKLTDCRRQVLENLNLAIYEEVGGRYKQIAENTGLGSSTLSKVLSRLKELGMVRQSKTGDPYYITEKGKTALQGATLEAEEFHFLKWNSDSPNSFESEKEASSSTLVPLSESENNSNDFNNKKGQFHQFHSSSTTSSTTTGTSPHQFHSTTPPPLGGSSGGSGSAAGNLETGELSDEAMEEVYSVKV